MKASRIPGSNNKHKVLMYALSTCAWCKMTKKFLSENNIEFEYVDVDLCDEKEQKQIQNDILRRSGRVAFPALIVDDDVLIIGFRKDKISEILEI